MRLVSIWCAALCVVLAGTALAQNSRASAAQDSLFAGTFSRPQEGAGATAPGGERVARFTWDGDWFTQESFIIDAGGHRRDLFSFRAKFDGKEYPFTSHPNNSLILERLNHLVWLETERKGGRIIGRYTHILSDDGTSMTVLASLIDSTGKESTRITTQQRQGPSRR